MSAVKATKEPNESFGHETTDVQNMLKYLCKKVDTINTNYPRWMDFRMACYYSSLRKNTMMKHILNGDIYAKKPEGKWLVDRESIDAFMLSDMKNLEVRKLQILRAIG